MSRIERIGAVVGLARMAHDVEFTDQTATVRFLLSVRDRTVLRTRFITRLGGRGEVLQAEEREQVALGQTSGNR